MDGWMCMEGQYGDMPVAVKKFKVATLTQNALDEFDKASFHPSLEPPTPSPLLLLYPTLTLNLIPNPNSIPNSIPNPNPKP